MDMDIKSIKSNELKTQVDLVCTHCGKEHDILKSKEGKDFVFETDCTEEWCICVDCQNKCNQ
jgi:hypothetical protein